MFTLQKSGCYEIVLNQTPTLLEFTTRAQRALESRTTPLFIELKLYFSCMVKKVVHFREQPMPGYEPHFLNERLAVYFRPVTSRACSFELADELGQQPELELPERARSLYTVKKARIDFRDNQWTGEYWL